VNGFFGEKRQRGGRKRRKNKHREEHVAVEEYKNSEEKIREVREWKDRLYAHRMARKSDSDKDSEEEDYRPRFGSKWKLFSLIVVY